MIVNSAQLEKAAATIRRRKRPQRIPAVGIVVTAAQMDAAAKILREADPCVIRSPRRMASTEERPGFIEPAAQDSPNALAFQVGILPSTLYRIDRKGRVSDG